MLRVRALPPRKAVSSSEGMGKRPCSASRVAAMRPSVAAGTRATATAVPSTGTMDSTDTKAMNMKNRPDMASGWRRKVRMPSLTHCQPVPALLI